MATPTDVAAAASTDETNRHAERIERNCEVGGARTGIRVLRTTVRGSAPTGSAEPGLTIRHNVLRDALIDALGLPPVGTEAFGARLKLLLGLGIRRDDARAPGRGRGHRNSLVDGLDAALAFQLQRAFVPPSAIVALLVAERPALDSAWAAAARGEASTVAIAIDALAQAGGEGMRTGRFSEDPRGSLTLATPQPSRVRTRSVPAPRVVVDLAELHEALLDALRRAGVPRADLRRAGDDIAAGGQKAGTAPSRSPRF